MICKRAVTVALFLMFLTLSVNAQAGSDVVHELVMLFSAWSGRRESESIFREAARFIDYPFMAQRSLGESVWAKLEPSQKSEFTRTFRKLVEERYYPRWHKMFCRGKISLLGETAAGTDKIVKTSLAVGKQESIVMWRLHARDGELKVISLAANGKDLLNRLHARFQRRLQRHDFNSLLAWLKRKLDDQSD